MSRWFWVSMPVAFAVALGACNKSSEAPVEPAMQPANAPTSAPDPPEPAATPAPDPAGAQPPTAPPTASDVPPPPASARSDQPAADENCVKECLARNQMRAEAIEKIEQSCRAECPAKQ